jgi:hypothetical protein
MLATGERTVTVEFAVIPSLVAAMVASPTLTAVTTPAAVTVATAGFVLVHVTGRSVSAVPVALSVRADSACVVPRTRVSVAGVTTTRATGRRTVTVALPVTPSLVAVTVVVPGPTAVTVPPAFTVAIAAAVLAHVTARSLSTLPSAARTLAVSTAAPPGASGPIAVGVTSTRATGIRGIIGFDGLSAAPQAETSNRAASRGTIVD